MVDCGRCYSCLNNKRNGWTFRMLQETNGSQSALFITLTYDETYKKYASKDKLGNDNTKYTLKELSELNTFKHSHGWVIPTLDKNDVQLYNKRLRERIANDLTLDTDWFKIDENTGVITPAYRHWSVGEYGPQTNRPHYHIIAWNIPDTWFEYNPINGEYYSDILESLWDKGYIQIGTVNTQSIHYCAKYSLKGMFDTPDNTSMAEKPFAIMSRNPGIGQCYVTDDIKNYYSRTLNPYATIQDNYKFQIPRFYRDQIWTEEEREIVNEKSRLYCEEKEERARRRCQKLGIDYDLFKETENLDKMKRMRTKLHQNLHL